MPYRFSRITLNVCVPSMPAKRYGLAPSYEAVTPITAQCSSCRNNQRGMKRFRRSFSVRPEKWGVPMKWRLWLCTILAFMKVHRADCDRCGWAHECWGADIRNRLEELRRVDPQKPELQPKQGTERPRNDAA